MGLLSASALGAAGFGDSVLGDWAEFATAAGSDTWLEEDLAGGSGGGCCLNFSLTTLS